MNLFGRNKEKEQKEEDFKEDLVLQANQPVPGVQTEDYLNSLGRSVYMVMDPDVIAIVDEDKQLRTLKPAISHLNRLTKKDRKVAELDQLDYEFLLLIHKLNMNEDEYETTGWAKLQAFVPYFRSQNCDSIEGFKTKAVTEQIRIVRAEIEKKKRRILPF